MVQNMGIMRRHELTARLSSMSGANDASTKAVVACSIIMSFAATVLVLVRIWMRRARGYLSIDDWLIMACLVGNLFHKSHDEYTD